MREAAAGLPAEFVDRMRHLLTAEELERFLDSYGRERSQGLRMNPLKGELKELEKRYGARFGLRPVPWCREGFYYKEETRPGKNPLHEAGVYYIQEPSAMAVVSVLAPQPGERVLDLCAAPGGKTSHLAGRLMGKGLLVSNEIHPARAKILSQNVERMGVVNGIVLNESPAYLRERFPEFFDRIVVDAPCSGEGMFRKDEQARDEWSLEHIKQCAKRQQEILDDAAAMLRPGGRMVYSTCTFAPEEDEAGAAMFLNRHPEFGLVPIPDSFFEEGLSYGRAEWAGGNPLAAAGTARIWPYLAQGEGHFLALFEKKTQSGREWPDGGFPREESRLEGPCGKRRPAGARKRTGEDGAHFWTEKGGLSLIQAFIEETLPGLREEWHGREWLSRLVLFGDQVYRVPEGVESLNGLRVLRPGLHLGTRKKDRFEPSHALALALRPEEAENIWDLPSDSEEIRRYLAGESIRDGKEGKGWTLVCTDGFSLGWGKRSGGVIKNWYPKGLRRG